MSDILKYNDRNLNLDLLRIIAIAAILLIHTSGGYLVYNSFNNGAHWWIVSVSYSSFLKWASGVFVMLSGAFLLNEDKSKDIWKFIKHRIIRIFVPFVIWAFIYKMIMNPGFISDFNILSIKYFLKDIYSGNVEYHLWFIYMLFILYLLTPIFSAIVNHSNKNLKYYFLGLWLVFNFFPGYISKFKEIQFGSEYYLEFVKYSGFYILGFTLKNIKTNYKWWLILGFIGLSLINVYGTYNLSHLHGYNDYFFLNRLNITNILNAIFLFVFFNSLNLKVNKGSFSYKLLVNMSLVSYGIFLNHVLILHIFRSGKYGFLICTHDFLGNEIAPFWGSLVLFTFTFILSSILALVLGQIPILKKLLT